MVGAWLAGREVVVEVMVEGQEQSFASDKRIRSALLAERRDLDSA